MKPILKTQTRLIKKDQLYRQALIKLPLKVTFALDQDNQHHQYTKIKYKRSNPKSISSQSTIYNNSSHQNLQNAKETGSQSLVWELAWDQNQFRRQNTQWNNFILIYNPKFTMDNLYCGKCSKTFSKIVQFIFHCLSQCKEICHAQSSHFILEISQWKRFLSKQINKQKVQQINVAKTLEKQAQQPNIVQNQSQKKEHIKSLIQKAHTLIKSDQNQYASSKQRKKICKNQSTSLKKIHQFTKQTILAWKNQHIQADFIFEKHYLVLFNLVMIVNPQISNLQNDSVHNCAQCKFKFQNKKVWFLIHYKQKCTTLNNPKNRLLFLNAKLFFEYLYLQKKYILSKNSINDHFNLPFLVYLYENTSENIKIDKLFPKFKYYINFIKIYYSLFDDLQPQFRFQKNIQDNNLLWKSIKLRIANDGRKLIHLDHFYKYLGNQVYYCPQKNHDQTKMSYSQFVTHLETQHPNNPLYICISSCSYFQ